MPRRTDADHDLEDGEDWHFRPPRPADGPAVSALIAASPPLDRNSAYCNLLQCTHFAEYCIVAERGGELLGWVSGYRPPSNPVDFFVWQVAVAAAARGQGLARKMIARLLDRPSAASATHLITTVTADNAPSRAMFAGLARQWGVPVKETPLFEREAHFAGAHDTEWQLRIGPLPAGRHDIQQES